MSMTYSRALANTLRNGQLQVTCRASGRLAWSTPISDAGSPPPGSHGASAASVLLLEKDLLVADGERSFTGVSTRGRVLWTLPKWPATPLVLEDGLIHHVSPQQRDLRCASDVHGRRVLDHVLIPGVAAEAWLPLFEPIAEGLIVQVQYTDFPDLPARRVELLRVHRNTLGPTWSWEREGGQSQFLPLSLPALERLVTFVDGTAIVLDRAATRRDGLPLCEFPYPWGPLTAGVSASADGRLYWCGVDAGVMALACTDLAGSMQWSWHADASLVDAASRPIAAPTLAPAHAVVLSPSAVTAVARGKTLWQATSRELIFTHATALADGSALVVAGSTVARVLADGSWDWRLRLPEPIVAPAVVDALGAVFVLGRSSVHGIQ